MKTFSLKELEPGLMWATIILVATFAAFQTVSERDVIGNILVSAFFGFFAGFTRTLLVAIERDNP